MMNQLNCILAATDLSVPANFAVERAALLSKELKVSRLNLIHVANLAPLMRLQQLMSESSAAMEVRVLDTARQKLLDLSNVLQQRFGVMAQSRAVAGRLLEELLRESNELPADLLVCGAKGESLVRHLLLGATALRILSTTKCPVLVVKTQPVESYRRLLVPVDFSPSSLRAIAHARMIAPQAEIVLLHVFEVPFEGKLRYASVDEEVINQYRIVAKQEASEKLRALRDEAGLTTHDSSLILQHGDPSAMIIEQAKDCDLLVMGKHGEGLLEALLVGSVTKYVLTESQCDVLVSV